MTKPKKTPKSASKKTPHEKAPSKAPKDDPKALLDRLTLEMDGLDAGRAVLALKIHGIQDAADEVMARRAE